MRFLTVSAVSVFLPMNGSWAAQMCLKHGSRPIASCAVQLQQLAGALAGRIITVDAFLTTSALEALLGGGCLAVVCQTPEAENATEPSVRATYFATLYQELHTGSTLLQASCKLQPVLHNWGPDTARRCILSLTKPAALQTAADISFNAAQY